MLPEEIIIAPVVTEKSNDELQEGKYTFKVNKKATKVDIARAVEKLFEVKVLKVNTINVNGKAKRVGTLGKTKVTSKKTRSVNNRPNCLKITKRTQKVNLQTITTADGKKIRTSAREARTMKKNSK